MTPFKQRTTIFTKIVVLFIVLTIAMTSIGTYVSIYYESKVTKDSIISTGRHISEFIASSTENAFYSLNWIFVSKMLNDTVNFMDNQLIYALLVRENGTIYMASDEIYQNVTFDTGTFGSDVTVLENHSFPSSQDRGILMSKKLIIGTNTFYVVLGLSIEPIRQKNRAIITRNLYIGALSTLVGLLLALVISRNLSGPLTKLANAVTKISPTNIALDIETGASDEVGVLENTFKLMLNDMRITQADLELSKKELEKTAAELKTANDELEFRVKERTRELEDAQTEQERLIMILESTSDIVMSSRPDGAITYMNSAGKKLIQGGHIDTCTRLNFADLHPGPAFETIRNKGIPTAITHGIWEGETLLIDAAGNERTVSQVIMAHFLPDGELDYLSTIMRDISEQKQAREKLIEAKNYIDDIINSMPSALIGADETLKVTQCNIKAVNLTGVPAIHAIGKTITDLFPHMASMTDRIKNAIQSGEIQLISKQTRIVDNKMVYEDITIYPLVASHLKGAVIRIDDVSESVAMEEMIIQSEKMLSVGGLAAGMAHEINNPLAGIMQNTDLVMGRLRKDLPANHSAAENAGTSMEAIRLFMEQRKIFHHLEMIHYAGSQAARIVQNMLSFARPDRSGKTLEDIAALFNQTADLVANDYDLKHNYDFKQIEIIREYGDVTPKVPCEASKIQQVFLNILKNGAQAMYESKTENPCFVLRLVKETTMLRIEIQDNGPGMDEETCKHLFEPFYTTKEIGAGTGLGLSISYFIIKENHGGSIEVDSTPGQGASFVIRLPLQTKFPGEKTAPAVPKKC